jgi:hypothetical protein
MRPGVRRHAAAGASIVVLACCPADKAASTSTLAAAAALTCEELKLASECGVRFISRLKYTTQLQVEA